MDACSNAICSAVLQLKVFDADLSTWVCKIWEALNALLFKGTDPVANAMDVPKPSSVSIVGAIDLKEDCYFSADEGDISPNVNSELLNLFPDDVFISSIWPKVLHKARAQDICRYRLVSSKWKELVSTSPH